MQINADEIERLGGRSKNPDIDAALRLLELNSLLVPESECCQQGGESCGPFDDQERENERLREALKPFADAVYNDNGDMTITPCGHAAYAKAYFVMRELSR